MFELEDEKGNILPRRVYSQEIRKITKEAGKKIKKIQKYVTTRLGNKDTF